jgi:hypothetical protein
VLNSADVHAYNNTFVNARVSFERNDRVAAGDVFDWHTTTGPGLEQREGHIFLHNLMAASDSYRDPLLEFGQMAVFALRQAPACAGNGGRRKRLSPRRIHRSRRSGASDCLCPVGGGELYFAACLAR